MSSKEIVEELLEREYELCREINACYKKAKEINTEIYKISKKFSITEYRKLKLRKKNLYNELEYLEYRKMELYSELNEVKEELLKYKDELDEDGVLKGEKVDLYKALLHDEDYEYSYKICLKGTKEIVGQIEYGNSVEEPYQGWEGDISYNIKEEYRGNGFALDALKLLTDRLYKEGIKEVYVATSRSNTSSQRVAEKFGGEIDKELSDEYSVIYKCDLKKIKEIKKR